MKHEQKNALIEACRTDDEVRIIASNAARERRQDVAIAIRHLVDGREQAENEYKRQRLTMATQILAGLAANPGGPYQENQRSGWGLCNCGHSQAAGEALALADSLMVANAVAPIPHDAKESNAKITGPGENHV